MSILIKGMEMPTRCGRCDMRIPVYDDGMFDHYECCITAAIIDNLGEKMEDCPLLPVRTPHGDLVDRDVLEKFKELVTTDVPGGKLTREYVSMAAVRNVKTIITASEEGET